MQSGAASGKSGGWRRGSATSAHAGLAWIIPRAPCLTPSRTNEWYAWGIMFDGCCRPEGRKATRCSVSSTKSDGEIIGRPLESKVCPIICCGLKAEPPERGRGTPRDSRTSRRRKNDEVLGTPEPLRHSQSLDDERLPPEDPFPTGISSPMAFHPLHLPLPALPKCGLRHVSPEHSSRTR